MTEERGWTVICTGWIVAGAPHGEHERAALKPCILWNTAADMANMTEEDAHKCVRAHKAPVIAVAVRVGAVESTKLLLGK
jgi:hypothetical protein